MNHPGDLLDRPKCYKARCPACNEKTVFTTYTYCRIFNCVYCGTAFVVCTDTKCCDDCGMKVDCLGIHNAASKMKPVGRMRYSKLKFSESF